MWKAPDRKCSSGLICKLLLLSRSVAFGLTCMEQRKIKKIQKARAKKAKDLAGKQQSRSVQHGSEPQWAVCAEALIKLGSHKSCCTAPQPLRSASERLSAVGLSNRVSKASTF